MECYDISHTFGERTVASCVVFNRSGPLNSAYRIFNIEGITAGDDFAAMDQVLHRRFLHADSSDNFPDILFIDGGDGQLSQGEKVIKKAREKFPGYNPLIVGISKGEGRKHGLETLHMGYTREEIHLPVDSQAFLMIQHIRDESHRFAITNHRKQRSAHKIVSRLEQIEGIGSQKRRALLNHFGGINEITSASREEIAKVKGIGEKLAEVIYTALHKS
jgi:excinuclease ABC subunit C